MEQGDVYIIPNSCFILERKNNCIEQTFKLTSIFNFQETISLLKEVSVWTEEKYFSRRKNRVFSPTGGGMEAEDALGLSVEGNEHKLPEDQLAALFPGMSGDIAAENFHPSYYLLENHRQTEFDDLQAGLGFLRRKVRVNFLTFANMFLTF